MVAWGIVTSRIMCCVERGIEMAYGDKRDYRKIDLIVGGEYRCSTTWAKTLKEAVEKWREANPNSQEIPRAVYAGN
jgi:hypothetical protein